MRIPTDNFRSPAAMSRFFLVCLIGLGLDLWTKSYSFHHLAPAFAPASDTRSRVVEFIPGWVHFEIPKWFSLGLIVVIFSVVYVMARRQGPVEDEGPTSA